ncbi:Bud-site selection protein [Agrocybe pediades]|nr:Bud-site selection protein [Agrocybe pediades]
MDTPKSSSLKRKRYEPPEEHHEIKEVHKASKRAKVFETQKVVKRLKDLRKKDAEDKSIGQFEEELTTLKDIDHDAIGNSAFRTKVLKDHTLRDNEDLKNSMSKELGTAVLTPAEPGTTLAKIRSRLLSSKILALQVTASINALKILLNPALKQRDNAAESAKAHTTSKTDETSERPSKIRKGSATFDDPQAKPKDKGSAKADISVSHNADEHSDEETDEEVDDAGWESGSISGDGGGLDNEDDGWESGSIAGTGSDDENDEEGDSASESDSEGEELRVETTKSKPKAPAPDAKGKASSGKMESTFLPSLSVGFVRGSDESDFSEGEDGKVADMPKKNRRGQRARRAIWEKKFGRNANHKKKEAAEAAAAAQTQSRRNSGHTSVNGGKPGAKSFSKQGSVGMSKDPRSKTVSQQHQPADSGWAGRSKGTPAATVTSFSKPPVRKGAEQSDKPLHPSWEAKRKLKEKESVGIVPSQGKKIKF